ncbi:MAG: T9SS type A sorting domain-containing protein [Candidatus Edwardsbacteria bacterium]|nr:T9SS type A sorting domain-containing protein [Candidatus Edwardsbacteria bacterium]MBU1576878.1 T9SS type A sorting domain-containing protein [Candidatus Edwardsbacteria bacterium]MBU2463159.1 T9SS type A sorting domain-containing protein [Candidatus Edwardsbacteria bacterium]MBU2593458.1 T9SS type A sorting domain-containing protein [Candidatus Edwardsbacteria bacterium]
MGKHKLLIAGLLVFICGISWAANTQTITYKDSWSKRGITVKNQTKGSLNLVYSVNNFNFEEKDVEGAKAKAVVTEGSVLPIGAGYPDLPVISNYVAVPNGAVPRVKILSYREERFQNVDIAPGMEIPTEQDKTFKPLAKNTEVYSKNEFFPSDFVIKSPVQKMRGVDVFILSLSPFRYNPVTKELIVRRDMEVEVTFEGGKGEFGDDLYRHPMFERILQQNIINYSSLEPTKYSEIHEKMAADDPSKEAGQFEYIIIVPNDPIFIAWADTLKLFRKKQGIKTGIFTTAETGNTPDSMEAFIDNAYNTWTIKPLAVLMMSDLAPSAKAYGLTSSKLMLHPGGYPQYVSDNVFADINITNTASTWDNGGAPEMVFARMPAQTVTHCSTMVRKIIRYETSPPSSASFYNTPISAAGWQTDRWFGICTEIVRGFLVNKLGKTPAQQYNVVGGYSAPAAGAAWSSTNPSALVAAYGTAGEGYIANTVPSGMNWNSGSTAGMINAVNNGGFMIMHRDHGLYSGWGEPDFQGSDIASLTNTNHTFVFSMNCQTGAFQYATAPGTFSEIFHRSRYGALGVMCATEVSYSFVNDAIIMGIMDGMWPNFNTTNNWDVPNAGTGQTYDRYTEDLRPAFAMVSGKWHLMTQTYTDPAIPADYKEFTCQLFHVFGDPFMTFCSQVPDTFALTYNASINTGTQTFNVNVKKKGGANLQGALVGLYMSVPAKGSTKATDICTSKLSDASGNVSFTINPANAGQLTVTATKSNFVRGNFASTVSLPGAVSLASFTAAPSSGGVLLSWQTASEVNCQSWRIERSTVADGSFDEIGTVNGNGTVYEISNYQFTDASIPTVGEYYYKLVEIDVSGKETTFGPINVSYSGPLASYDYKLEQSYPNPTTGGVAIKYSLKEPGQTSLKIYNILGAEIKTLINARQNAGSFSAPWNGRDNSGREVAKGVYFYKLVTGNFSATRKLMLLR